MTRRRLTHVVGPPLAGVLGPATLRTLGATWKIRVEPADLRARAKSGPPAVFAFWHGTMLVPAVVFRGSGAAVMISRHADGEVIARIIEKLGYTTVRGSSTRGGASALHEAVQALRGGRSAAFTPDGPKGPAEVAQPGAVFAASRAGVPLLPIGVAIRDARVLRSWDRFRIPKPFTRVVLLAGEPLRFPADVEGKGMESACARVSEAIRAANAAAGRLLAEDA